MIVAEEEKPSGDFLFDPVRKEDGEIEPSEDFAIGVDDLRAVFPFVEEEADGRILPLESFRLSKERF